MTCINSVHPDLGMIVVKDNTVTEKAGRVVYE